MCYIIIAEVWNKKMADKVRDKNKLKNAIVTTRSERDKLLRVVFVVLITIAAAAFLIFSLYWLTISATRRAVPSIPKTALFIEAL